MLLLVAGLLLLIGVHLIPMMPKIRQRLVLSLGRWPYKSLFALVALAGLWLIIAGMGQAPQIPIWQPPAWGRWVPQALMLPALVLLVAAYVPGNIRRFTPHPMLWGVILWAAGHLLANGDRASLLLFGSLGLYALAAIVSANRRGASPEKRRGPWQGDLAAVVVGVILYGLILINHGRLFGVAVLG